MNFQKHSHRYGEIILNSSLKVKHEIESVVESISVDMIEQEHQNSLGVAKERGKGFCRQAGGAQQYFSRQVRREGLGGRKADL